MIFKKWAQYCFPTLVLVFFSFLLRAETLIDLRSVSVQNALKNQKKLKVPTFYDPAYKTPTFFWAYPCSEILRLSSSITEMKNDVSVILEAADGYRIPTRLETLRHPDCFLSDSLAEKETMHQIAWKEFSHGKERSTPAPFYLIWKNGDIRKDRKPWPWSLVAILKGEGDDAVVKPKDKIFDKGYQLYKAFCISCHSINLVGGSLGFEMNIPKNITEYLSFDFFSSFVVAPESYRANSKMPAQKLSKDQLEKIWSYLQAKSKEKI